jgi:protein phosphatase 4 regulatory subunit 3
LSFVPCRYDPELPERQKHRDFLRDRVVFREVVPISDALVRAKIHQTYRMGYLKDVILPRYLSDDQACQHLRMTAGCGGC